MASAPGSSGAILGIVDRIVRLTANEQAAGSLPQMDLDQLRYRAAEAAQMLGPASSEGAVAAAAPTLCALAVACVGVVESAELSTGLARLVSAGCEVLAGLLATRSGGSGGESVEQLVHFSWVDETLEDLSDQLDFLSLEVYCGLARLESAVTESDALPIVLDPGQDSFGTYWGSLEHRQALQDLSAWLLCVVFRALGHQVSAKRLMEFANHDCLLLCALLRGLFAAHAGDSGLPDDLLQVQGSALDALCGLTAPELAFSSPGSCCGDSIEAQNQALDVYLEVVCAAVVETGLFGAALDVVLASARKDAAGLGTGGVAIARGAGLLGFFAALVLEADTAVVTEDDPRPPPIHFREELYRHADKLGSLLEAVLAAGSGTPAQLRGLVSSCAALSAALAAARAAESSEDGFTLACRMLLQTCLEAGLGPAPDAVVLAALAALAANVEDLEISHARLSELIAALQPEGRARARSRLVHSDKRGRLPVYGDADRVLMLFDERNSVATVAAPSAPAPRPLEAPRAESRQPGGLRNLLANAPQDSPVVSLILIFFFLRLRSHFGVSWAPPHGFLG
ncbi:unnamed protein product [Prorocentrum cordatum]|uniref:Uncharacterized protein n=1 Tax=Prorocentrum cordatum TaxID=2364126 RepID=A0ABN9WWB4_9DINO|nr:unnamed protein product [Polarella glacialis]